MNILQLNDVMYRDVKMNNKLDREIMKAQKAVNDLERSNEPTAKGALKLAKADLSYLLTLLDDWFNSIDKFSIPEIIDYSLESLLINASWSEVVYIINDGLCNNLNIWKGYHITIMKSTNTTIENFDEGQFFNKALTELKDGGKLVW